jgi:bifunctional DNase/RNase
MTLFRIIARLSAAALAVVLTVGWLGNVAAFGEQQKDPKASDLVRVKVHNMILDPRNNRPVVSLADLDENRAMLIWIGENEARAIYAEMEGVENFRPLTHDLFENVLEQLDGSIQRIIITHTKDNVYYATLEVKRKKSLIKMDARPSDSIVMALKFKAPIFVSKNLFEEASLSLGDQKEVEEKYGLTLQDLTPELAEYWSFESNRGVLVAGVRRESRAEADGMEVGDIIVELAGRPVSNMEAMRAIMKESDKTAKARIYRKQLFLSITLQLQ